MARKRPSQHSADQFALFVAKIRDTLDGEAGAKFDEAVSKLVRSNTDRQWALGKSPVGAGRFQPALPEKPEFDQIEREARETADSRNTLLLWIGRLVFNWSNNESLLVYVLMLLLGTDERSAAVVFATLNTTRARLGLVHRLMLLKVRDPAVQRALAAVIDRFNEAGRVRNDLLHAMYSVNERGEITHTQAMRFAEKRGHFSFGDRQPVDEERLAELKRVADELISLNRDLWDLLPRLRTAVEQATASDG